MFFINRSLYTREQVDSLSRINYGQIRLAGKPIKLYKYYPDTVSVESGKNHSQEALEHNTVFLQDPLKFDDPYDSTICLDQNQFYIERLKYYADLCGFVYNDEWDYGRLEYEFSLFLYPRTQNLESFLEAFKVTGAKDDILDLTHHNFALNMWWAFLNNKGQEDCWQRAFYSALNREYTEVQKNLAGHFRIACFTTNPYSMLMWAHYANSHKGFCIEYAFPSFDDPKDEHLTFNLFPVIYSDERVSVLKYCLMDMASSNVTEEVLWPIYKYGLLTKSLDWMYQNEWRLISCDDLLTDKGKTDYTCTFSPITKVYLGAKMPFERRKDLAKYCADRGIPTTCVAPATAQFAMQDCAGSFINRNCLLSAKQR